MNLVMSSAHSVLPFFQLISSGVLSNKDIKKHLQQANKKIVDAFGEICLNICCLPRSSSSTPHSNIDKLYLKRFGSSILIIADKKNTFKSRKGALIKNPQLVRKISNLAVKKLGGWLKK